MASNGRPTKYLPATVDRILTAVRSGTPRIHAGRFAGIADRTMSLWLATKPEFKDAVERAESEFIAETVARIATHGRDNWQALAWILERRWPADFGRQDRIKLEMEATLTEVRQAAEAEGIDADLAVREAKRLLGLR
jgi:transposase